MTLALHYAARSDVGLRREGNEDSVYAGPRLLAVADGMGGHAAGEVASAVAVAHLARLDDDVPGSDLTSTLRQSVSAANEQLAAMVSDDDRLDGMGTTLTALLADRGRVALVHVGDSRAYLLRDGTLTQISHDHTLVQSLVDDGEITEEEAESHPQRSLLLRALDGRADVTPDVSVREAREGDRFLLCSDGLSGVVSFERLGKELVKHADPQVAVDRLVDLALRAGAPDNVSVVVADVVAQDSGLATAPLVGGAASAGMDDDQAAADASRSDVPSVRAALARKRQPDQFTLPLPPRDEPDRPRRLRRAALVGLGVVVVLGLLAGGALLWVRGQWFIGSSSGRVALFQGITNDLGPVSLHRVDGTSELPVDTLPERLRVRVVEGIPAQDRQDAVAILGRLGDEAVRSCEAEQSAALAAAQAAQPQPVPATPGVPGLAVPAPPVVPTPLPVPTPCPSVGSLS